MAELKTQKTDARVDAFIDSVDDESKRADCRVVSDMMGEITGEEAAMWGTSELHMLEVAVGPRVPAR